LRPETKSSARAFFAACCFFAVLLVGLTLQLGSARGQEEAGSGGEADTAERVELPEKRTATSETFQLENGELETKIYEAPVNYRDPQGDWQPIDEELVPAAGAGLTNGANEFDLHLQGENSEGVFGLCVGAMLW
jgi:hypothetical protein